MRKGPRVLARPIAEAGSSLAMSLSSPEPWRKEEDEADRRDPPVSDRMRRGNARAVPAQAERERAGLRAEFRAAHDTVAFPFSFCANFALCLILYNKSCANSKIMTICV